MRRIRRFIPPSYSLLADVHLVFGFHPRQSGRFQRTFDDVTESIKPPHDDLTFNTTPNILTLLRIAFVPVVVACLYMRDPLWDLIAAVAFGIAGATDALDGYVARVQNVETVYGKLLDPLADKFLVISSLVMLLELGRIHAVIVILLICRELAITGLRALASAEGVIIAAGSGGKWKTGTQMVAIPFLMVKQGIFGIPLFPAGMVLLYISLAISLWSAKDYIVDFFIAIREKRRKKLEYKKAAKAAKKAAKRAAKKSARGYPR